MMPSSASSLPMSSEVEPSGTTMARGSPAAPGGSICRCTQSAAGADGHDEHHEDGQQRR